MIGSLEIHKTTHELIRAVAERIERHLIEAIAGRGVASIALSGGLTPKRVYELLASDEFRSRIDWGRVHLFWGDERCVPHFMRESNFRMVHEALLERIAIPERNIHRVATDLHPTEAARAYEAEITEFFGLKNGQLPEFDVLLLGLGEDGHIASLFPGTTVLNERSRLVAEVYVEKLTAHRITLTLPVINNAANVMFIISGKGKATILQNVLEQESLHYPAQMVNPIFGRLYWLVDSDAASLLQRVNRL